MQSTESQDAGSLVVTAVEHLHPEVELEIQNRHSQPFQAISHKEMLARLGL